MPRLKLVEEIITARPSIYERYIIIDDTEENEGDKKQPRRKAKKEK